MFNEETFGDHDQTELITGQLLGQCAFQLNTSSPSEKTFPLDTGFKGVNIN